MQSNLNPTGSRQDVDFQIGIDFGGTKIEGVALDRDGNLRSKIRIKTPKDYQSALVALKDLIQGVEREAAGIGSIGIGTPGSVHPLTGLMRNANTTYLNDRPLGRDLSAALDRPIRLSNDANCLALSEAVDGAAAGARIAFAVIIGTGVGGGLVVDGEIVEGGNGNGGEWGHVPLPWLNSEELCLPKCWCGLSGCLDIMISGTGFSADYARRSDRQLDGPGIIQLARENDLTARLALDTYIDRLGRSLAMIVNIVDPDVFVLGGGMSNVEQIYAPLPDIIRTYAFGRDWNGKIAPARWGDSSGVRGAARLWPLELGSV